MNHLDYFNFIEEKLCLLATRIEMRGKLNILDLHIHSEIFYRDFFNLLFEWRLEKTELHNEQGIDLVDIENNIVVSVSATATKEKIESSLKKVNSNYSGYAFRFISISKNASKCRPQTYSNPHELVFSPADDIYDVSALLKLCQEMRVEKLKGVFEYLKKEIDKEPSPETLKPIERLKNYLHGSKNWKHGLGEEQNSVFHYEQYPEFTIVENTDFDGKYNEPWVLRFPDKLHSSTLEYFVKYQDTILTKVYLVCCDGGRFVTAEPRIWCNDSPQTYHYSYYFIKDSIEYLVAQMVTTIEHHNNCREPSIYNELAMFESEENASQLIEADFAAGMLQYIFYSFDREERRYSRIERGKCRTL